MKTPTISITPVNPQTRTPLVPFEVYASDLNQTLISIKMSIPFTPGKPLDPLEIITSSGHVALR